MLGRLRRAFRSQPKGVAPATELEATKTGHSTEKGVAKLNSQADNGAVKSRKPWRNSRRVVPFNAKEEVPASPPSTEIRDKAENPSKVKKTERLPQSEKGLASILRYSLHVSLACTDLLHLCPDAKQAIEERIKEQDKKEMEKEESQEGKRARAKASAERKLKDRERLPGMNAEFVLKRDEADTSPQVTPVDDIVSDDPILKTGPRIAWAE